MNGSIPNIRYNDASTKVFAKEKTISPTPKQCLLMVTMIKINGIEEPKYTIVVDNVQEGNADMKSIQQQRENAIRFSL